MTWMSARAQRMVALITERQMQTVCAHCGGQPIEWHHPSHANGRQNFRISRMVKSPAYTFAEIEAEMNRCTPLCRRCHMVEDGRIENLKAGRSQSTPGGPCQMCGRIYKPLRRNLCMQCYQRQRVRIRPPLPSPAGPKTWSRQPHPCSVDSCSRVFYARGVCKRHYDQWRFHGEVVLP